MLHIHSNLVLITQYVLRFLEMITHIDRRSIKFHFLIRPFKFVNRNDLKNSLKALFELELKKFNTLTYVFCSDEYLLEMNKTFLQHDYFTDILTFDLSENNDLIVGDIYISIERVKDNAEQLQVAFTEELRRVIFHGALHLCGYKDNTKRNKALMRNKEDYYLNLFK